MNLAGLQVRLRWQMSDKFEDDHNSPTELGHEPDEAARLDFGEFGRAGRLAA